MDVIHSFFSQSISARSQFGPRLFFFPPDLSNKKKETAPFSFPYINRLVRNTFLHHHICQAGKKKPSVLTTALSGINKLPNFSSLLFLPFVPPTMTLLQLFFTYRSEGQELRHWSRIDEFLCFYKVCFHFLVEYCEHSESHCCPLFRPQFCFTVTQFLLHLHRWLFWGTMLLWCTLQPGIEWPHIF